MHLTTRALKTDARKKLRQHYRNKRNGLSAHQQETAARNIVTNAISHKLFVNAKQIALYMSFDGELNTQHLITYLWSQAIDVYLPVVHPFCAGHLIFLQYDKSTIMSPNAFGILEPELNVGKVCPVRNLDVIFTPLVAFDESGNRLGMGGGFYDRTLHSIYSDSSGLPNHKAAKKQVQIIGLAHDMQHAPLLPTQEWDIPLTVVLSPTTLYRF